MRDRNIDRQRSACAQSREKEIDAGGERDKMKERKKRQGKTRTIEHIRYARERDAHTYTL